METELVTRNIIDSRRSAFFILESSISPLKCLVRAFAAKIAVPRPIAKSANENRISPVVTPSRLKFAAPQR